MSVMRGAVLAVADNRVVSGFFRSSSLARGLVSRFVAGETVETAIAAGQALAPIGITTTLDLLGENVGSASEAQAAVSSYTSLLRALSNEWPRAEHFGQAHHAWT